MMLGARPLTSNAVCIRRYLLAAAAAALLSAQDNPAPVIRTSSRLVQVNVAVTDKKGSAVSGLSQDDFQILDNGRPQNIVHFLAAPPPERAAAFDSSPLVLSNRSGEQAEGSTTTTIILVDELVEQEIAAVDYRHAMQSARLQVLKFVATLQRGEQVALYALRPEGVVVLHDFASDPTAITQAAKSMGSGLLRSNMPKPPDDAAFAEARTVRIWAAGPNRRQDTANVQARRVLTGSAFQAIANRLRGIAGRKNLVWISASFPQTIYDFEPGVLMAERDAITPIPFAMLPIPANAWPQHNVTALKQFARWLSDANISVYPMDAMGLMGPLALGVSGMVPASTATHAAPNPREYPSTFSREPQWQAMELIASETGGHAFYNTNGFDSHLREIVDQTRMAYVLGYYPGDEAWDGTYHTVEVKLKPGALTARYRKGYMAADQPLDYDPEAPLREAAAGPLEASMIGITLNVSSNPLEWFSQDVVVKLDAHQIHFEQIGGRWRANVDLAFVQLGTDGRILEGLKDNLDFALYPRTHDEAMAQGWFYPKTLVIRPEAEKLRVVARDLATGAVGSVSIHVRRDTARTDR